MVADTITDLGDGVSMPKSPDHEGLIARRIIEIRGIEAKLSKEIEKSNNFELHRERIIEIIKQLHDYSQLRPGEKYSPDLEYVHSRIIMYGAALNGFGDLNPESFAFSMRMNPKFSETDSKDKKLYESYIDQFVKGIA